MSPVLRVTVGALVTVAFLLGTSAVAGAAVRGCPAAVVYRGTDYDGGPLVYVASHIRRSSRISCGRAVNMLSVTYGYGPLKPIHIVKPTVGRYTWWLRGGWRMTNGAGGATVWNVRHKRFNEVGKDSDFPAAVVADVGIP